MTTHILHMTSGHEAFDTRITAKQCASLAAQGYRVTLVARQPLNPDIALPEGVTLVTVPRPKGRFDRFVKTTRHVVAAARAAAPDIYHFHDPDLLPLMLQLVRRGENVIYDVHEDYRASVHDRQWLPAPLRSLTRRMIGHAETRMGQAGWISAATPDIANLFQPDRTALVQNFPSLREFETADPVTPYSARDKRLIYVGSVTAERGVSDIMAALPDIAARHPDMRFDLVGPASEPFLQELKSMPGWAWTTYHGRKDRHQVVQLLHQARAGLVTLRDLPRYRASQPTKLYEYMAASLPVIASDFPRWKAQVGEDIGYFGAPDAASITDLAMRLLDTPKDAEAKGRAGRQKVIAAFSWEVDFRKLVALYEKAMTVSDHRP